MQIYLLTIPDSGYPGNVRNTISTVEGYHRYKILMMSLAVLWRVFSNIRDTITSEEDVQYYGGIQSLPGDNVST